MRNMQLVIFITAFMLAGAFIMPSHAQIVIAQPPNMTANATYVPISGNITFDPDNYNGVKVTDLTIYARSPDGVDTKTNPAADGSFSMNVPGNGTYSIWVFPSKFDYLNKTTNQTYSITYPDDAAKFTQNVTATGLSGIVIPSQYVPTGIPFSVTPAPPTLPAQTSPQPTPGFTMLAALAAAGALAGAVAYRKR